MRNLIWILLAGIAVVALAALAACATTDTNTRPEDMSAAEHRAAAVEAEREARRAEVAPEVRSPLERQGNTVHGLTETLYGIDVYDPGAALPSSLRAEADAHARAAEQLERFEQEQCAAFPAESRVRCPLLGTVAEVTDTDGGALIRLRADVNREAVTAHIRCHQAFARTQGFEGMDACPLYLRGLSVRETEDGVELAAPADEVDELRARARTHVAR